ncbi:transposase [Streptomyces sp. SFB5A]|uniref:Transposase n=1 Tax=Streptomyces nymphaeiformis TaxID=2663842 RepID=A0A7W7TW35_9ACTN|nr:transposase [Streptomyces nymphaeiformis]
MSPEQAGQKVNRLRHGQAGGRPPAFDSELYRVRNVVERCVNGLKQFRVIATRYKAGVHLAALILWLREPIQDRLPEKA